MKNQSNYKLSLQLFRLTYGLFLTYSLLGHIEILTVVLKTGTFFALSILIFNLFHQYHKSKYKEFLAYIILFIISLINSYYSGNYGFLKLILFAGSIRTINFKDIIKFDMYLRIVLLCVLFILLYLGIATDVTFTYNGILRHSLGFQNPNSLGIAVFILVCDILYVANMKLSNKLILLISGISYWLYSSARSRTAVYLIIAIMILAYINRKFPNFFYSRFVKLVMYLTPAILSLLTLILVNGYINYNSYAIEINKILSQRIKIIVNFVKLISPSFFGQPIGETLQQSIDNTYAWMWYALGIFVFILFHIAYIRLIKKCYKEKNISLSIIMFMFMIYGLSEHLWLFVDYNIYMLAFFYNPKSDILAPD